MPDGAAGHERIFDFRTVVLTCAQLPHFIDSNDSWNTIDGTFATQ